MSKCELCPKLCKEVEAQQGYGSVHGAGNVKAKIMIVGGAVGADEVAKKQPFMGRAGIMLRKTILVEQCEIDPDDLYMTYAVKCRLFDDREPTASEMGACRTELVKEIKRVKPRVIIACGAVALKSLTGLSGVNKIMGSVLYSSEFSCYIVASLHPSALLLRKAGVRNDQQRVIEAFHEAVKVSKKSVDKPPSVRCVHVKTEEQVAELLCVLRSGRFVLDIETTGLDYHTDVIRGIAFAGSRSVGYFVSESVLLDNKVQFASALMNAQAVIMHNSAFDGRFLRRDGLAVGGKWIDTLLLAHLANENEPHDLDYLSYRYTRHGGYKSKLFAGSPSESYATVDVERLATYAAMDAVVTYELSEQLIKTVTECGSMPLYDSIVEPCRKILNEMSASGVPIDIAYLEKVSKQLSESLEYVGAVLSGLAERRGVDDLNVDSPKQIAHFLYNVLNLPCFKQTSGGADSTDEEAIRKLENAHAFPALLSIHRKLQKLYTTYIKGTQKRLVDGKLYTEFLSHGTVTGRLCVAGDTQLQTSRGVTAISELDLIKYTDIRILTHRGNWRRIIAKYYKGVETMYRVTLSDGSYVTCTGGHRVLTPEGWQAVDRIKIGSVITVGACKRADRQMGEGANSGEGCRTQRGGGSSANYSNVVSIECIGRQDVWDIEVEGDHSYYAQGMYHHNSSRNPNLQNLPRDSDIRKIIAAPTGYELIEVDGSQIEVRFLAHYTNEPFLIEAFKRGEDIHGAVTAEILGTKDYTKEQRTCFKQVVFGISYGMEAQALAAKLTEITGKVYTEAEAERYRQTFFARMKNVPIWIAQTVQRAKKDGYVRDLFGKVRRLPALNSCDEWLMRDAERQAVNSIIQGSASYLTNLALVRIAERMKCDKLKARVLLTVHDSIVAVAPKKEVVKVKKLMVYEFEHAADGYGLRVPIKVDVEHARAWGQHKESAGVVFADIEQTVKECLNKFKASNKKIIKKEKTA